MIRPYPPVNDITTSPEAPPQFFVPGRSRAGARLDRAAARAQQAFYADLAPLVLAASAARVFTQVEVLARRQWTDVVAEPDTWRLQAIAVTPLLRFRDDVVVELRAVQGGSCEVHMRSKSRLGRGDLGANAKRIRAFLAQLKRAFMV